MTDDSASTGSDFVTVTVIAANQPPVANAGTDQAITLPTTSVALFGSATDSDGTVTSTLWTQVSGPVPATIASPAGTNTNVTDLTTAGTYTFRLTATDNVGATGSDDVIVNVTGTPNQAPTANAGTDLTIALPTTSAALFGSATDTDGTVASTLWTQVSGPVIATIASPANLTTNV
ncbi:MAG: hypothetical protein IIA14_14485, partial [SAR324 cluster bacterium]|nr:hypothetical protein [SAR324 cluster bacterium]